MIAQMMMAWTVTGAALIVQPEEETQRRPVDDARWVDPHSGRSMLNYPPHRAADVSHIRLDLRVADMNTQRVEGAATLTLEPIARPLATLRLNAAELRVESAASGGFAVSFTQDLDAEELTLRFEPPVPLGQRVDVRIGYTVSEPDEGIIWTVESPDFPGRAAQLHTQGESESARYWFPCPDFPNERLSSELVVTVPAGFTAVSNGRLESRSREGASETFHWKQDGRHVAYLVSLVVGKFDVVDVAPAGSAVPMPVYAPPGTGGLVAGTFGRTGQMVLLFERLFDEPFPWEKYAQVLVWNFGWGGMENTSATTLVDTTLLPPEALPDGDEDGLISHELAHQWFGDLVTCRSWEHIWLNEGFATYSEKLWEQYRASGTGSLRPDEDAYLWGMLQDFESIIDNDRGDDPFEPSMQCKCYAHPVAVFEKAADPYSKGSSVLHMLREYLGDAAFFRAVGVYLDRHKFESVEAYSLRRAFEDVGGVSLQRFFAQWCTRPGVPRLAISHEWSPESGTLKINVEQTQRIDGDAPAYAFSLPVWVRTAAGEQWLTVEVEDRVTEFSATLDSEPQSVVFDPRLTVLAERSVHQPADRAAVLWLTQLRDGPTLTARIEAAEQLALEVAPRRPDAPPHPLIVSALDGLAAIVASPSDHYGLRQRAAVALGTLANPGAAVDLLSDAAERPMTFPDRNAGAVLATLARGTIDDARVRRSVIEQLARAAAPGGTTDEPTRARVLALLSERLHRDTSVRVRAAAVRGVGTMRAADGLELIAAGLETESFADTVRREALRAYADLGTPEALGAAIRLTRPGTQQFTREAAAEAVARLAAHDEPSAVAALAEMLGDASQRAKYAAAAALGQVGTPAARAALEDRKSRSDSREFRHHLDQPLAE